MDIWEGEKDGEDVFRRAQWLRAAILGANDGLLSTASLMLGVGAAKESRQVMVLSGVAGAVAGALSMALGEFVSVSTQRDIEKKAAALMKPCLEFEPHEPEKDINISIIVDSPLKTTSINVSPTLKVRAEDIRNCNTKRALEEDDQVFPNPYKAAAASAMAFLCGSVVPLASAIFVARNTLRVIVVVVVSSLALVVFGGVGAHLGGSPVKVSAVRVLIGGWIAMGITYGLLKPFDKDKDMGGES